MTEHSAKKAMITGASEGIGHALAKALAKEGYLITGAARSEAKLKQLVTELGPGHKYLVADLSTTEGYVKVAEAIESEHFDLMINNAGVGTVGKFTEVPLERQMAMVRLNCEAVTYLSYAYLKTAKHGDALINTSSTLAFTPMPSLGLYCATKSFVTALSETLWFENRDRGVYVLGLCPGATATGFQVHSGGNESDVPKSMQETPEDVVRTALKALRMRSKPTVISGMRTAMFAGMSRIMPRKSLVTTLGKMMAR